MSPFLPGCPVVSRSLSPIHALSIGSKLAATAGHLAAAPCQSAGYMNLAGMWRSVLQFNCYLPLHMNSVIFLEVILLSINFCVCFVIDHIQMS